MKRVALVVALLGLAAACTSKDPFSSLPDPKPVVTEPTTTTTEIDYTGAPLAGVAGSTTTTVVIGPGPLTIVGKVEGPDGVVPDAVVQLERVVGDHSATTRVPTAPDGTWNASNVLGGRYRIRAWRVPDLATSKPQVVFLETGPQRAVSIRLEPVGGQRVDTAVAPDPPIVDEAVNLKVRVAVRSVDADGTVRDEPQAFVSVTLTGSGEWQVSSSNPATTDTDGSAVFNLSCRDDGPQPLSVTLDSGSTFPLLLPACVERAASTTTSATVTTSTTG